MDYDILTLTKVMDSLINFRDTFNPTHNIYIEINEEVIKVFRKIQVLVNKKNTETTFKYPEPNK